MCRHDFGVHNPLRTTGNGHGAWWEAHHWQRRMVGSAPLVPATANVGDHKVLLWTDVHLVATRGVAAIVVELTREDSVARVSDARLVAARGCVRHRRTDIRPNTVGASGGDYHFRVMVREERQRIEVTTAVAAHTRAGLTLRAPKFADRVAARPQIAAFLASPARMPRYAREPSGASLYTYLAGRDSPDLSL